MIDWNEFHPIFDWVKENEVQQWIEHSEFLPPFWLVGSLGGLGVGGQPAITNPMVHKTNKSKNLWMKLFFFMLHLFI